MKYWVWMPTFPLGNIDIHPYLLPLLQEYNRNPQQYDNTRLLHQSVQSSFQRILTTQDDVCLLYTSPSPRDATLSRMPSSA